MLNVGKAVGAEHSQIIRVERVAPPLLAVFCIAQNVVSAVVVTYPVMIATLNKSDELVLRFHSAVNSLI
jgi:hypothetical protein